MIGRGEDRSLNRVSGRCLEEGGVGERGRGSDASLKRGAGRWMEGGGGGERGRGSDISRKQLGPYFASPPFLRSLIV